MTRPTPIVLAALACTPAVLRADEPPAPALAESAPVRTADAPAPAWPALSDPNDWTLQLQPRVWYVSPAGRFRLPSTTALSDEIRLETFDLDSPEASPFGALALRGGPWTFTLTGAHYSSGDRTTTATAPFQIGSAAVAPGNLLSSSFEYTMIQLDGAYRFYTHDFGAADDNPGRTVLRLDALLGARVHDLDVRVTRVTPTVVASSADPFYAEPFAGLRADLQIIRDFTINLELSGGGLPVEDAVYSFDIIVGFTWRPVEAVGLQLGWRQLLVNLEDDDGLNRFEYDGTLAGLYAGLTIRF